MLYMADKQGVLMLEKSAFNRHLHRLAHTLQVLLYYLADFFKALNLSGQYLIDSFPVAVCDNIRIGRSRLVEGQEYRAKIASKRRFFFGFRIQLVTTVDKQPVQFFSVAWLVCRRNGFANDAFGVACRQRGVWRRGLY
ncbi:hypothetical protein HNV11_08715 [Spirosoma taeanense]|uniref:Transposase DDE domain-containing protein n=1 Tax=Spirosoma taeanense TaxID=2735870 RepID=A0A6M5Y4K0_9BACT|nr:hypothetical protein [Spirosoma taeanense]QJW89457.1 hypothetical protein HNV11_08715 [Spirosoma taeanense]